MTADDYPLDHAFLGRVANRIHQRMPRREPGDRRHHSKPLETIGRE